MTAAVTAIGIQTQARVGILTTLESEPLSARIAGGLVDYVRYLFKLAWPYPMALPQPFSPVWPNGVVLASGALLAAVTVGVCARARRRPYLPVGWFWFLGVLVPVIGIVQPGQIPLTDRYTYLPHIGLIIAVAWGIPDLLPASLRRPRWMGSAAAVVLLACAAASIAQARHWKDSVTLFEHAVRVTPDNFVAHYNLANALAAQGRAAEAIAHYDRAKSIRPGPAHNTLGSLLAAQGRLDEAIVHFREAVRAEPKYADAHNNLGVLLARQGNAAEARREYEEALRYRPRHADALLNLGRLDAAEGRLDPALARLGAALEANPELDGAYYTRANTLAAAGRFPEAEADFRSALRLRPGNADAHNNLGRLLALQGRSAEAMAEYDAALRLAPDHALALANRAELVAASPPAAPAGATIGDAAGRPRGSDRPREHSRPSGRALRRAGGGARRDPPGDEAEPRVHLDRHHQQPAVPVGGPPPPRARRRGSRPAAAAALHRPPRMVRGLPRAHRPDPGSRAAVRAAVRRVRPGHDRGLPPRSRPHRDARGQRAPPRAQRLHLVAGAGRRPEVVLFRRYPTDTSAQGHERARDHVPAPRLRRLHRPERDYRPARAAHDGHPGHAVPAHRRRPRGRGPDRGGGRRPPDRARPVAQAVRGRDYGDRVSRRPHGEGPARRRGPTWPRSTPG